MTRPWKCTPTQPYIYANSEYTALQTYGKERSEIVLDFAVINGSKKDKICIFIYNYILKMT